jgi:hypothetical protein|tara:strand:+ start:418 stop:549 length:132 start_codon:yes stop_codon:yes gene_type:complete
MAFGSMVLSISKPVTSFIIALGPGKKMFTLNVVDIKPDHVKAA